MRINVFFTGNPDLFEFIFSHPALTETNQSNHIFQMIKLKLIYSVTKYL